jgi:hypothetical protein
MFIQLILSSSTNPAGTVPAYGSACTGAHRRRPQQVPIDILDTTTTILLCMVEKSVACLEQNGQLFPRRAPG